MLGPGLALLAAVPGAAPPGSLRHVALLQRVPVRLAHQPLPLGEGGDQAARFSCTSFSSRSTVSAFCMPATAPCSAALAYRTLRIR